VDYELDPDPARVPLHDLARRQHGVVSLAQLERRGFTRTRVLTATRAGWLHPVHRGIYALGHTRLTVRGRWMAAVLATGPGAVLSHRDAASLWNLVPTSSARTIHVTAPSRAGRAQRTGITVHRPRELAADHRCERDGIPVTSLARTLYDVAATRPPAELAIALHEADHQRIFDLGAVTEVMGRHPTTRATKRLDAALAIYRPEHGVPRLELERLFLALCEAGGIPRPRCNAWVALSEGGGFRPDFSWPDNALTVEVDGWQAHGTRRAFRSDRRRDRRMLVQHRPTARFTWAEVSETPEAVAKELRDLRAAVAAQTS
jgi:putative AbiEi antitoxin of type IV toxin-antitoxin system